MPRAIGIQKHQLFKLGRAAARRDKRNLLFGAVLKAKPRLPAAYDFDATHVGIPTPMFGNDVYGDCVIAGRAHQTLRFERIEQGSMLMIADRDVTREYFKETGGADVGLVVLDSLKAWRSAGWKAGTRSYAIRAFAEVNRASRDEVRRAVYADVGVGIGLALPLSAQQQIQTGQIWDLTAGPGSAAGTWGGHYVYVSGYTPKGPVCVTWGRKQEMTWPWFAKYCDEAYAIFDAKNRFKQAMIEQQAITTFLAAL